MCVFVCMTKAMQLRRNSYRYMNELELYIEDTSYHCYQQDVRPGLVKAQCRFVKHCFSWTSCKIGNKSLNWRNVVYLLINTKKGSWRKVLFCFHSIMRIFISAIKVNDPCMMEIYIHAIPLHDWSKETTACMPWLAVVTTTHIMKWRR